MSKLRLTFAMKFILSNVGMLLVASQLVPRSGSMSAENLVPIISVLKIQ